MSRRKWTDEALVEAVKKAESIYDVFRHLNLKIGGGQHLTIKQRIKTLGLDVSHFKGQGWSKGKKLKGHQRHTLESILVENSTYQNNAQLKKRLLMSNLLQNKCYECQNLPMWQGKTLVLRLDHINGIRNDNRITNLRLLCPNCDSQQPTFCGKNIGRYTAP